MVKTPEQYAEKMWEPDPDNEGHLLFSEEEVVREAMVEVLTLYAWWRDGVQYVGSGSKTLAEAIKDLERGA